MMGLANFEYMDYNEIIHDESVSDCLMDVYFSMLSNDQEIIDKHYNKFEEKYNKLNDEQKELVKVEYQVLQFKKEGYEIELLAQDERVKANGRILEAKGDGISFVIRTTKDGISEEISLVKEY